LGDFGQFWSLYTKRLRSPWIQPTEFQLLFLCTPGLPDGFFKPKIPIWVIFEGLRLENIDVFMAIWNICQTYWIFYDHLVHFVFNWYILCSFGTFFPALVSCTQKNLATLVYAFLVFEHFCALGKLKSFATVRIKWIKKTYFSTWYIYSRR
jgi:hypothetical protein